MYECTSWKKKKEEKKNQKNSETLPRYLTEKKEFYIRKKFPHTKEKGEQFNEHTCATYGGAGEVNGHEGKSSSNRFREKSRQPRKSRTHRRFRIRDNGMLKRTGSRIPVFSFVSPLLSPLPWGLLRIFSRRSFDRITRETLAARRFPPSSIFE